MNEKHIRFLCCPKTRQDLTLVIENRYENSMVKKGLLRTEDGQYEYPIINGIPRFIDGQMYSSSFGYEWQKWPKVQFDSENIGKPMQGHTTNMFKKITALSEDAFREKIVVEFGCGSGRFLDIVRKWGAVAIGIDMSIAVEVARNNFKDDEDVLIVQGDILEPPFKENLFDISYSIGVLHHTPAPQKGVASLANITKPLGDVIISVYSKNGFYAFPSVNYYRKLHYFIKQIMGSKIAVKLALFYAWLASFGLYYGYKVISHIPVVGRKIVIFLEKYVFVNVNIHDSRWRFLDIFDAITPQYASTHTPDEIVEWYTSAGCTHIQKTGWEDTSFKATKR